MERNGLVITKAVYGSGKALKKGEGLREVNDESASEVIDVTVPLNFLVNDAGQLKVCFFQFTFSFLWLSTTKSVNPDQVQISYIRISYFS